MHPSNKPSLENIDDLCTYHAPTQEDVLAYGKINLAIKEAIRVVLETCPDCADRTAAIRELRNARMTANASIALNPK